MPIRTSNYIKFFVAAVLAVSCCLIEADAQTKKKRTRRTTTKTTGLVVQDGALYAVTSSGLTRL